MLDNSTYIQFVLCVISFLIVTMSYSILLNLEPNKKSDISKNKVNILKLVKRNKPIINICFKCNMKYEAISASEVNITHCLICDKCVVGFNHHCFWVNKCIGKRNISAFYIFLISVCLNLALMGLNSFIMIKSNEVLNDTLYVIPGTREMVNNANLVVKIAYIIVFASMFFLIPVMYLVIVHLWNEYTFSKSPKIRYSRIDIGDDESVKETLIDKRSINHV